MALYSKEVQTLYYSPRSEIPAIRSPKNEDDWQEDKTVIFEWGYNGFDLQLEYTIEILKISEQDVPLSVLAAWENTDSSDSASEISSIYIYSFVFQDTRTRKVLDLSEILSGEGVFLWRIKTRGVISQEYSDWANDGSIRIDSQSPFIRNASIETPALSEASFGQKSKLASSISDFSAPYLRTRRDSDSGYDRHIDRDGESGLYIYYDYRDHSLVLRAQKGNSDSSPKQRYYGMISFHQDVDNPCPTFSVQDALKMGYVYTINAADGSESPIGENYGAYQNTFFNENNTSNLTDQKIQQSLDQILNVFGVFDENSSDFLFIPRCFPAFWQGSILDNTRSVLDHPATIDSFNKDSFFSVFPFHTTYVKPIGGAARTLQFPLSSGTSLYTEFIELRYPAPFHDVFVYFNTDFNKVLAYGRYSSMDDVNYLAENPNAATNASNSAFQIQSGFDVQSAEGPGNLQNAWDLLRASDEEKYQVFHPNNSDLFNRTNLVTGAREIFAYNTGNGYYPIVPVSNYLFFNLVPDDNGNDVAMKLYLNDKIYKSFEQGIDFPDVIEYFEFHMFPHADCALAYKGGDLTYNKDVDFSDPSRNQNKVYKMPISMDRVFIGRAKTSPKDLSMFDIDLDTAVFQGGQKNVYKYLKYPNQISLVKSWSDEQNFIDVQSFGDVSYNGSFRLEIPKFKFIPYYHPDAVLYNTESQDVAPLPHIYEADPNNDIVDLIPNWDSINIRTSALSANEPNDRIKFDYLYPSDVIKMEGSAQYYSQSNPHYYNHGSLEDGDYKRGTVSRIKGMGWLCDIACSGDLAYTLFDKGWSPDYVWYNTVDRGYYGIADIEPQIKFINSSLMVFANGQLLIGEDGVLAGFDITSQYNENEENLHEFYFNNIGSGGLDFPPRRDDHFSFIYQVDGDFRDEAGYAMGAVETVAVSQLTWNISGFGSGSPLSISSGITFLPNTLNVYLNGMILRKDIDYVESNDGSSFKFLTTGVLSEAPVIGSKIGIQFYSSSLPQSKFLGPYHFVYDGRAVAGGGITYSLSSDFGLTLGGDINTQSTYGVSAACVWINGKFHFARFETTDLLRIWGDASDFAEGDVISFMYSSVDPTETLGGTTLIGAYSQIPKSASERYSIRSVLTSDSNFNTKIRLKDFSNYLWRDSLRVLIEENLDIDDYFVDKITPVSSEINRTYIWDNSASSVLNSDINNLGNSNGPIWAQYKDEGDSLEVANFVSALSGSDNSFQGYYGASGVKDQTWSLRNDNMFAGYYLIEDQGVGDPVFEQIKRVVIGQSRDGIDASESLFIRGPFTKQIDKNTTDNGNTRISGDVFSMGNIFGVVNPESTVSGNIVNLCLDLEEGISGINGIKTFIVDLDVDAVDSNGNLTNVVESPYYVGAKDSDGNFKKIKILMQRLNNEYFSSSDLEDALEYFATTRSPLTLVEEYFNTNISTWKTVTASSASFLNSDRAGRGKNRFKTNVLVSGSGYKLLFIQVKDRANNVSNIYCVPFAVTPSGQITSGEKLDSIKCNADEDIPVRKTIASKDSIDYVFEEDILIRDKNEFRSISLTSPLSKTIVTSDNPDGTTTTTEVYKDYGEPQNLLVGMSDNYGVSYNLFSPYTSVKSWRFDRPVAIPIKSFDWWNRGPEWYFDPNDIRHYTPDTPVDFQKGIGSNNNITPTAFSGHIPGNGTLTGITLVGFRAETISSDSQGWGKSSPIAEKIYEFREEFIGKKIILGTDLNQSFTILHIFKTNDLSSIKRWSNASEEPVLEIDGDNFNKVWLVVDDPEAICALILSRKLQYANADLENDDSERFNFIRGNLGTKKYVNSNYYTNRSEFTETDVFGYYENESDIPSDVNELVNLALGMPGDVQDGFSPINKGTGSDTVFYIAPSESIDLTSSIETNEGWVCQIFKAYDPQARTVQSAEGIADSINENHHQIMGVEVLDRLVFGESKTIEADIDSYELLSAIDEEGNSSNLPTVFLSDGRIDRAMVGRDYLIINKSDMSVLSAGTIQHVSAYSENSGTKNYGDQGVAVVLEDAIDISGGNYKFYVSVSPLQSTDADNGGTYTTGWWPDIDGFLVPPLTRPIGYVNSSNKESSQENIRYISIFNGAFYVKSEDDYTFLLEANDGSYLDMTIDYMRSTGLVEEVFEDWSVSQIDNEIPTSMKTVGGRFEFNAGTFSSQTFRLRKGWHTARVRYVSRDQSVSFGKNIMSISYRRSGWPDDFYVPFTGSLDDSYSFMAKSYRSVHARILDENLEEYPVPVSRGTNPNRSSASQYLRAVVGFFESLVPPPSGRYKSQIVQIDRFNDTYGSVSISVNPAQASVGTTYGAQMFEEAFGIYESNIVDGGTDFRFWRSIIWSPNSQPDNTNVKFYIRTAPTEEELLNRTWNNIGSESEPNIINPIEVPGTDILEFSQQTVGISVDDIQVNRFLQFRMVLSSRVKNVTPTVNDVTIVYSKLNSVNFFTTTFDLNSNIIRAILSYNGDIPEDPSGFAIADLQFGISTKEVTDGVVSTNFDDYAIIPINEAFTLSDLGINAAPNDKFRIGIKFISTENSIPTVKEFGLMWESEGKTNRTIDFL